MANYERAQFNIKSGSMSSRRNLHFIMSHVKKFGF
jgi:hypothetical protein